MAPLSSRLYALLACLPVFLTSCASHPPQSPAASSGQVRSVSLRLVTYNTQGIPFFTKEPHKRAGAIAQLVGAQHPDVVAFQEVFDASNRRQLCDSLAKAGLPYHHYFQSWVFGSGLLTVSRYPISDTAFHRYSHGGNPVALRQGDWWAGKGAGRSTIAIPGFGNIELINTHLHARYHGDHYKAIRQSQLDELMAFINANRSTKRPVLLLGDLNHRLSDPGWIRCIRSTGLLPLAKQLSLIDYIMAAKSPDFSFEAGQTQALKGTIQSPHGNIPVSDHTGLLTPVRITMK